MSTKKFPEFRGGVSGSEEGKPASTGPKVTLPENGSISGYMGGDGLGGEEEKNALAEFAHQNHHR